VAAEFEDKARRREKAEEERKARREQEEEESKAQKGERLMRKIVARIQQVHASVCVCTFADLWGCIRL
jgi:hypothetical protein